MINATTEALSFRAIAFSSEEYEEALRLRAQVLRKPLGLEFNPQELEPEKYQLHFAAFVHDLLIATLLLLPENPGCKMRQVAVHPDYQRRGIGAQFLAFVENEAQSQGFTYFYCHARKEAINFYLNNGYEPSGDYFVEVGIPHMKMNKILLPASKNTQ